MTDNISPNIEDDLTPLESPLDFAPDIYGSPRESLRLMRTDSSLQESSGAEIECPNLGRCASQQISCEICQRGKKEVSHGGLTSFPCFHLVHAIVSTIALLQGLIS